MFETLNLPKRYENLRDAAQEQKADITRIVRKVPEATARIEKLLRQITNGKMGRFELLHGPSGSGKTTFLSTLPKFYEGVHVTPISDTVALTNIPREIENREATPIENHVYVLIDRDNPKLVKQEVRDFFESLRRLFRTTKGRILIIWPITDSAAAKMISETAWEIGADSVVDPNSKGIFVFTGLPKTEYYEVAEITTRSLNNGQGLEAFGLGPKISEPLIQESDTISQFYGKLETKSQEINNKLGDRLKERRLPSVWVLVAGDDTRELGLVVANLTQGTEKRVDVDRILGILDVPESKTVYLEDWRKRRDEIAYLLRRFDVRIFELPPNVTVAAVRAFGDANAKLKLKKQTDVPANASRALQSTKLFELLTSARQSGAAPTIRPAAAGTADEYRRIQVLAAKKDKSLNKALAAAFQRALDEAKQAATVTAEQRKLDPKSNLQPDILVEFTDGRIVCLEPTWRTTGKGIADELKAQQSSMTVGHIQQYLLAKLLEYVKDFHL